MTNFGNSLQIEIFFMQPSLINFDESAYINICLEMTNAACFALNEPKTYFKKYLVLAYFLVQHKQKVTY